jgi:hypothetical protein
MSDRRIGILGDALLGIPAAELLQDHVAVEHARGAREERGVIVVGDLGCRDRLAILEAVAALGHRVIDQPMLARDVPALAAKIPMDDLLLRPMEIVKLVPRPECLMPEFRGSGRRSKRGQRRKGKPW